MKKAKKLVKVVSDEKDFSAVLDIITTHRSRALMSVNVENRYKKQLSVPDNFFQLQNGKSDKGRDKVGVCVNGMGELNIFQVTTGKSLPPVLALTSYTNLVIIANHCRDAQEILSPKMCFSEHSRSILNCRPPYDNFMSLKSLYYE